MDDDKPVVFTLGEVADMLQVHKETVRRAIKSGELTAAKVGREFRISKYDLERYWAERGGGDLFERTREPRPRAEDSAQKKEKGPKQLSLFMKDDTDPS
jgi:excisionase family DNA binding protein